MLWHGAPAGKSLHIGGLDQRHGREPIGLDVDGDGVDEAVGFVGAGENGTLFPAVIRADSVAPLWVGPPLGVYSGRTSRFIQARRGVVVVTTDDGFVLAFDALTGEPRVRHPLTARAAQTCVIAETTIRIVLHNGLAYEFDTSTLAMNEVSDHCSHPNRDDALLWNYGGGEELEFHARVEHGHVMKDVDKRRREVRVRLSRHRGGAPIWTTILGDGVPLALPAGNEFFAADVDGVFAEFERGDRFDPLEWPRRTDERWITRLDLETGATRWIRKVPQRGGGASGALVTKTHLWISRFTYLDVFEKETGVHTGYIGWR